MVIDRFFTVRQTGGDILESKYSTTNGSLLAPKFYTHAISRSDCRGFACEDRAKAKRIGSCNTLATFAGDALRLAMGLEPVETASSYPDSKVLRFDNSAVILKR
ncbi:Unannotated [Lentimonas sp. CC4]|nr:Unannotated [Lentimonas sp. CC4]